MYAGSSRQDSRVLMNNPQNLYEAKDVIISLQLIDEKIEQSDALCDKADDVFEQAAKVLALLNLDSQEMSA